MKIPNCRILSHILECTLHCLKDLQDNCCVKNTCNEFLECFSHQTHSLVLPKLCLWNDVDVTVMVKCCLFLFAGVSSQTCLGCAPFQTKSQSHKTSGPGRTWCFPNARKSKMMPFQQRTWLRCLWKQETGACFSLSKHAKQKTCHDPISDADFDVCPLTGYQFQWGTFNV